MTSKYAGASVADVKRLTCLGSSDQPLLENGTGINECGLEVRIGEPPEDGNGNERGPFSERR